MGTRRFRRRPAARKLNTRQRVQVKRMIGKVEEDKFLDVVTGATAVPSGSGVLLGPYTNVPQGDTVNGRTGDVIQHRKVTMKMQLSASDVVNAMRVIVFKWNANDAFDAPTAAKILQDVVSLPYLSPYLDLTVETARFTIMSDRLYSMVTGGDSSLIYRSFTFFGRKLGKKKCTFNPAATTGQGNIYVLAVSDSVAIAHPSIAVSSRLHFTDS